MFSGLRLFFEDDSQAGGNGASADVIETQQPEVAEKPEVAKSIISDEEIKGFGFDSQEDLKNFLAKHKESNLPDEEKKKKENLEKADFLKFSAEQNLLNVDEYNQFETLKSKSDRDLVWEKHLAEFKEDNPDIKDPVELETAAKEDFEFEYKLNSQSEAAKKRGESKLSGIAAQLRNQNDIEKKVLTAQEQYKLNSSLKETYPKFEKFVDETIVKNTPDKTVLYKAKDGDTEIDIEIELTKADRDAIAKSFKTPKTFALFTSAKPEEVQAALDKKIQGWIKLNKMEEVASKSFEAGKGVATKSQAVVGADNPFPLKQGSAIQPNDEETLEESNMRIAKERQKARQSR